MSFSCPICKSEETQKLSLIFEAGTSNVALGSIGADIGTGHIGVAGTAGTIQSNLAKRYAPPERKSGGKNVLSALILWMPFCIFVVAAFGAGMPEFIMIFLGTVALSVILIRGAVYHNTNVYPFQLAEWNKKMVCLRCGNVFEHM